MTSTALSTVGASPTMSTASPISARRRSGTSGGRRRGRRRPWGHGVARSASVWVRWGVAFDVVPFAGWRRGRGKPQRHLGAGLEPANPGRPAVALHPAQDGLPDPEPVLGMPSRSKPGPWSRTNASTPTDRSRRRPTLGRAVADGVQERLPHARTRACPPSSRSRSPVTTSSIGVPWTSSTSCATSATAAARVASNRSDRHGHERSSRSCARASWATGGRVVGLALDERERLEHGVVQVGGDVRALGGGRARPARAAGPTTGAGPRARRSAPLRRGRPGRRGRCPRWRPGSAPVATTTRPTSARRPPNARRAALKRLCPLEDPSHWPRCVVELRPGDHGANGNDEQRDEEAEPVEPGVLPGDDEPDDEQDAADEEHPRRIAGLAVRGALDVRGRGVHALTRARGPRGVDRHPAVAPRSCPGRTGASAPRGRGRRRCLRRP